MWQQPSGQGPLPPPQQQQQQSNVLDPRNVGGQGSIGGLGSVGSLLSSFAGQVFSASNNKVCFV